MSGPGEALTSGDPLGPRPEAVLPGGGPLVLAGWWRRVGAAVIDGVVVGLGALVILIPLSIIGLSTTADSDAGIAGAIAGLLVLVLVLAAVAFLYAPFLMTKTDGQTLGRMATRIRVVRTNGKPMTFGTAVLREIVIKALLINGVGLATFALLPLLDVLWPLWDDEKRALHDFLAQTRTVIAEPGSTHSRVV